jgi:hypothetical protein
MRKVEVKGQRLEVRRRKADVKCQMLGVRLRMCLILGCLGMFVFSIGVQGQAVMASSKVVQADELKTQEQMLDELKFKRAQVAALQAQVAALSEQNKTLTDLSAVLRERGDFYKDATEARAGAGLLEAERDRIRREQIEEYRGEVVRLRSENEKLRHSRDVRTIFGFAVGVGIGAAARK